MELKKSDLLALDLNANEAEVYLALVDHGACGIGPLLAHTGLHRNIVYTALSHLSSRKLISESQVRGRKQFSLNSPSLLVAEFERKTTIAKDVATALLERKQRRPQEITVHQGNDEYAALLIGIIRTLPHRSTKYVLGTGGEQFMKLTMKPIWKEYHHAAKAQGLQIRMLGYENQRSAIGPEVASEGIYNVRYLVNQLENPAGVHIYPEAETVLNIIYSDNETPVTAIRIRNKALTAGYLALFQSLWLSATA